MIEEGHLYIAQPPLYRVKKGKKVQYIKDDRELESLLMKTLEDEALLIDCKGVEYRGEELSKIIKNIRELEENYRALVKTKGEDIIKALLEVRFTEQDLRDSSLLSKKIENLEKSLPNMHIDTHYDKLEDAYEVVFKDPLTGRRVMIDADFLSSLSYRSLLDGTSLCFPVKIVHEKRAVEVESMEGLYSKAMELIKESFEIQRYKGLGEMNPEQLWETTMNPETRRLLRVTIEDAAEADRIFSILMGEEVEPRREFIEAYAKEVKNLDI